MRKIFIDCGYNMGNVTDLFQEKNKQNYEYFAFEANPYIYKKVKSRHPFCKLENKAVWIKDSTVPFYVIELDKNESKSRFMSGASTLNKKKAEWNELGHRKQIEINVDCIDFSSFILNNFDRKDEIIVKMDIEGAEYEVLGKMIAEDSISYINDLIIEFHDDRTEKDSGPIKKELENKGVKVKIWH